MTGDTELQSQLAIQFAVQRILAKAPAVEFRSGTLDRLNLYGPGVHSVIIDGDTDGVPVAAHQIALAFPEEGGRVAIAFVRPHQAWIIGNLQLTGATARAWLSSPTLLLSLSQPTIVEFDQLSYDNGNNFDIPAGIFQVPSRGLYDFRWQLVTAITSGTCRFQVTLQSMITTDTLSTGTDITVTGTRASLSGSDTLYLDNDEMVAIFVEQISGTLSTVDGQAARPDLNFFTVRQVG